jgi:MazG family protein
MTSADTQDSLRETRRLLDVMARLRDPSGGCPWDIAQTFESIAPYTIEEAYEVVDAIERKDSTDLKEELGDLLLQVVFHSRMAEEQGLFSFEDVAASISDKMQRRHPHVFDLQKGADPEQHHQTWEASKAAERQAKAMGGTLDDIPIGLPALTRAVKLTKRAARVGFDWPDHREVITKLHEELAELEVEIERQDRAAMRDELGDLLFVVANLSRKLDIEPEDALRGANQKFTRRFEFIETSLDKVSRSPSESNLEEMEALWQEAKQTGL